MMRAVCSTGVMPCMLGLPRHTCMIPPPVKARALTRKCCRPSGQRSSCTAGPAKSPLAPSARQVRQLCGEAPIQKPRARRCIFKTLYQVLMCVKCIAMLRTSALPLVKPRIAHLDALRGTGRGPLHAEILGAWAQSKPSGNPAPRCAYRRRKMVAC